MSNKLKPIIVISSTSCGGKTSTIKGVLEQRRHKVSKVITSTTRPRRDEELNGQDYHFYSEDVFHQKLIAQEFIEHDIFSTNRYGTERVAVETIMDGNLIPIISVTLSGVRSFHDHYPNACSIFLMPRNINEVVLRIMSERKEIQPDDLERRIDHAKEEMATWNNFCDFGVVTDHGQLPIAIKRVVHLIDQHCSQFPIPN